MSRVNWRVVFKLSVPVGMGYLPIAFAFGALAVQAGLSPLFATALSVFVFAGALQFAAVPLLMQPDGVAVIALTTLLINLRHVLYAIPLVESLPQGAACKAYVVAALTDENYSVLTTLAPAERRACALAVTLLHHAYWITGTIAGALLGSEVSRWIPNLGFALPALFTILAIEQYRSRKRWQPAAIGVLAYVTAKSAFPGFALIAALASGLVVLLALSARTDATPLLGAPEESIDDRV